jgi:hypothetical protein
MSSVKREPQWGMWIEGRGFSLSRSATLLLGMVPPIMRLMGPKISLPLILTRSLQRVLSHGVPLQEDAMRTNRDLRRSLASSYHRR